MLNLIHNIIVLEGRVSGRGLGHESTAFRNGIDALTKRPQKDPVPASAMWGYCEKTAVTEEAGHQQMVHQRAPDSDFQPPHHDTHISVVYRSPSLWHFVIAARMDLDTGLHNSYFYI